MRWKSGPTSSIPWYSRCSRGSLLRTLADTFTTGCPGASHALRAILDRWRVSVLKMPSMGMASSWVSQKMSKPLETTLWNAAFVSFAWPSTATSPRGRPLYGIKADICLPGSTAAAEYSGGFGGPEPWVVGRGKPPGSLPEALCGPPPVTGCLPRGRGCMGNDCVLAELVTRI